VTLTPAPPSGDASEEISVLIRTLRDTDQRLDELTAGQIDTVADRDGRSFLLQHAQGELRYADAAKQAAILNALPAHIILVDAKGLIISVNDAWHRLACRNALVDRTYGIGLDYLAECDAASADCAADAHKVAAGIRAVLAGTAPRYCFEYPCTSPAEQRWFLVTVTPLDDERPKGAVVMHVDITEQKRGEERSRRFGKAMDAIVDAIYLVDRSSMRFIHVNDAACRMQERTREQLLALEPGVILGLSRAELERVYDALIADRVDAKPLEMLRHRADGSSVWVVVRRQAHRSEVGWTIITMVRDVSERKVAEERLAYLAYYDVLTGLANRALFLERVAQYLDGAGGDGRKVALLLVDLQRFRNINDSLGRSAGDALLRQVAEWLTRIAGGTNLLARVGVDLFAVVLPDVGPEGDLARFVEKTMRAFLEHSFVLDGAAFRISAKVGIAVFPEHGSEADTLFQHAEAALKEVKTCGDRYLFYTRKMSAAVAGKLALENQLHQALDREEFVLHYQPKVNLMSGSITGVEALIRWNNPRGGLIPPAHFVPILEETGLIHEVGRWALRKAVEDYLRWRASRLVAVRVAVNVSALQLHNRHFVREIELAIAIHPLAAAGLELEITESLIMGDIKHNIECLRAIRAMGVAIAVDDFGTGFSSLSYLAKLPIHTLKIDRSFVTEMTTGPEGLVLVSAIIKLAHSLKLNVVAEGVETEQQSRLLRSMKCDEMQGYLLSMPVSSEILEERFLARALPATAAHRFAKTQGETS
jgi:diguanylate cyclase (GGDEF)-like protein/PAS domain S-box-containing protein